MTNIKTISTENLYKKTQKDSVLLLDVRTPAEYREIHIKGALSYPLGETHWKAVINFLKDKHGGKTPIYVVCASGNRSSQACKAIIDEGHGQIVNVEGGTKAWAEKGYPTIQGKKVMPIMGQVQITAGSLVVAGCALGFYLHDGFYALSAFVGAGLVYAGLSGSCAMATLLGKMPWNR